LYEIEKITKKIPDINSIKFNQEIINNLILKEKFSFNKKLFSKINDGKFSDIEFENLSNGKKNIKNLKIKNISDGNFFKKESVKLIYLTPLNNYTLASDKNRNIYLVKVKHIEMNNLKNNEKDLKNYKIKSQKIIINNLYETYDLLLNKYYKVDVNNKTIERIKNYFR